MSNSEFVHFMRTAFSPFMPNGIPHVINWNSPISVLRAVRVVFFIFIQVLIENNASKQWKP